MVLAVEDGGKGLMAAHQSALTERGIEIWYDTPAIRLLQSSDPSCDGAISGIVVRQNGQEITLSSKAVVLAAGGFESSAELRTQHLGKDWANARVSAAGA
jgi:aspartate oxidase